MRSRSRPTLLAAIFNEHWAGPNPELGVSIAFEGEILHYVSLVRACGTFCWSCTYDENVYPAFLAHSDL